MARQKDPTRDAKKVNLFLDKQINARLEELATFEKMGKSAFVEMLVLRWDEGINPQTKLHSLFKQRELANQELMKVDQEIKDLNSQIIVFDEVKRDKARKKPEALASLQRLIVGGDIQRAEEISKFWQKQTGVSAFELFMEAKQNVDKEGR